MTVEAIKNLVMYQTNNDADDLGDFMPYLMGYINESYDLLVYAWTKQHCSEDYEADYAFLITDQDVPNLPEWTHKAIADWATWLVYRNGNPSKQNRGYQFRAAFEDVRSRITSEGGKSGSVRHFINIPR